MKEWFAAHSGLEQFFLLCAIVGGIVVILRLILTIAGLDDHDGAMDSPHADSDAGFQLLSIQGVAAFFTLLGLVGYTVLRQTQLGSVVALVAGVVSGFLAMWIIHRVVVWMMRLQSSGTLSIDAAAGCEGTVYVTVTGSGGTVQVKVSNRLREFEAVSANGESIAPGTPIRVSRVAGNRVVVARMS